jgi:hypothetical protein
MNLNKISKKLRSIYALPADWKAYDLDCLPQGSVQVTGSQKVGKRKACIRSFLFTNEEYENLIKG